MSRIAACAILNGLTLRRILSFTTNNTYSIIEAKSTKPTEDRSNTISLFVGSRRDLISLHLSAYVQNLVLFKLFDDRIFVYTFTILFHFKFVCVTNKYYVSTCDFLNCTTNFEIQH